MIMLKAYLFLLLCYIDLSALIIQLIWMPPKKAAPKLTKKQLEELKKE